VVRARSFDERRKLEAAVVEALLGMEGDLKGDYYPLHGSRSYEPKPNGMDEKTEEELRSCGNLFQEPDSTLLLASGMGRHWPDGRGIFCNDKRNLFVWLNEEDHMRIVSMQGSRSAPTFSVVLPYPFREVSSFVASFSKVPAVSVVATLLEAPKQKKTVVLRRRRLRLALRREVTLSRPIRIHSRFRTPKQPALKPQIKN